MFFFQKDFFTHTKVLGLIEKGLLFPGKMLVCGWNLSLFGG